MKAGRARAVRVSSARVCPAERVARVVRGESGESDSRLSLRTPPLRRCQFVRARLRPALQVRHLVVEDEIAAGEFPVRPDPAERVFVVARGGDRFAVLDHSDLHGTGSCRAIPVEGDGVVVYAGEGAQALERLAVPLKELFASERMKMVPELLPIYR